MKERDRPPASPADRAARRGPHRSARRRPGIRNRVAIGGISRLPSELLFDAAEPVIQIEYFPRDQVNFRIELVFQAGHPSIQAGHASIQPDVHTIQSLIAHENAEEHDGNRYGGQDQLRFVHPLLFSLAPSPAASYLM